MANRKQIVASLKAVTSLRRVTNGYQQLANIKAKQMMRSVEVTRTFLSGVQEVYTNAKQASLDHLKDPLARDED